MDTLYNILGWNNTTAHPEVIIINGKRNHVVESYAKLLQSPFFEKIEAVQLDTIKRVFTHHQLPFAHPLHKKVHDAIAKTPVAAFRKAEEIKANRLKERMLSHKHSIPSSSKIFNQNCMTIHDTKKVIQDNGFQLQELYLNEIDDEVLAIIVQTCSQLTTLRIVERTCCDETKFTDSGLQNIANLPLLNTLELSIWSSISISTVGLLQLLNQSKLQKNLTSLSVSTYLFDDSILNVVSQYENLTLFSIQTTAITSKGMTSFLQSASIKSSLQSLSVLIDSGGRSVFDTGVLTALSGVSKLNSLTLNGGWSIIDQNLLTFLQAKSTLPVLGISGYPISQTVLTQIASMSSLQNLELGDCSQVTQFSPLIQAQKNLTTLSLGNVVALSDIDLANIGSYQKLTSLSLLNASNISSGFETFCNAPNMIKNLQSFYLRGNAMILSKSLGMLKQLGALTTLRLENVPYFNDDTLHMLTDHDSVLRDNLETLELNGVSISNDRISKLPSFIKMTTLMLTLTYAVTKDGMKTFLKNKYLQHQLKMLYLSGQEIDHSLIKEFNNFHQLESLYLGNMVNLDNNPKSKDLKTLWNLSNLKKNNTEIVAFWGELTSFGQFLQGL